jgi:hypothetical protein
MSITIPMALQSLTQVYFEALKNNPELHVKHPILSMQVLQVFMHFKQILLIELG